VGCNRIELVLTDAARSKNTVFRVGAIADAEWGMDFNKECRDGKNGSDLNKEGRDGKNEKAAEAMTG